MANDVVRAWLAVRDWWCAAEWMGGCVKGLALLIDGTDSSL